MKVEWHQPEMASAIRSTMELLKEPQLSVSSCSHGLFYCTYSISELKFSRFSFQYGHQPCLVSNVEEIYLVNGKY